MGIFWPRAGVGEVFDLVPAYQPANREPVDLNWWLLRHHSMMGVFPKVAAEVQHSIPPTTVRVKDAESSVCPPRISQARNEVTEVL